MLMICSCMLIVTQYLVRNCWSLIRQLIDVLLFGKSDLKMPVLMWSCSGVARMYFLPRHWLNFSMSITYELHDSMNLGCQESCMLCYRG